MGLSHFAIKAAQAGYKVLYVTCENSAEVASDRIDAAVARVPLKDLDTSSVTITTEVAAMEMRGGLIEIVEFAMGTCKVSDVRRVIRRFQAKGIVFDMLVVDYADEMAPERFRQDERHNLKSIYTDLRALCSDENLAGITATQSNRSGAKATTAVGTDVAEDYGKVRVADAFITINATEDEKKNNQLRLYLANMRNSEGGITLHCASDRSRMVFISRITKVA
jgi:replicative DNA helicase